MLITVMSDASFCPTTKAAGYGYWIACDRGKIAGSGAFRVDVPSSGVAELLAAVNAIDRACKEGLVEKGDMILVQSDCLSAVKAFSFGRNRNSFCDLAWQGMLHVFNLRREIGFKLKGKHVKGHSANISSRFASNNLCDQKAYEAMQKDKDSKKHGKVRSSKESVSNNKSSK